MHTDGWTDGRKFLPILQDLLGVDYNASGNTGQELEYRRYTHQSFKSRALSLQRQTDRQTDRQSGL